MNANTKAGGFIYSFISNHKYWKKNGFTIIWWLYYWHLGEERFSCQSELDKSDSFLLSPTFNSLIPVTHKSPSQWNTSTSEREIHTPHFLTSNNNRKTTTTRKVRHRLTNTKRGEWQKLTHKEEKNRNTHTHKEEKDRDLKTHKEEKDRDFKTHTHTEEKNSDFKTHKEEKD